jgi:hypothetical protein
MRCDLKALFACRGVIFLLSANLISRIVFAFYQPKGISPFAPDEGAYAFVSLWVSRGMNVETFPDYGPFLYNSSKTLILPSALLIRCGLDQFLAVKIVSSLYGLLTVVISLLIFVTLNRKEFESDCQERRKFLDDRRVLFLLFVYSFLPSAFLWSIIGLRESASWFFILCCIYFILKTIQTQLSIARHLIYFAALLVAILLSFSARSATTILFLATTMICIIPYLFLHSKKFILFLLMLITSVGIVVGHYWTLNNSSIESGQENTSIESGQADQMTRAPVETIIQNQTIVLQNLDQISESNRQNANSALPSIQCDNSSESNFEKLICFTKHTPFRVFTFLFRPLFFIDNGSTFFFFASLENVLWLTLFGFAVYLMIRFRLKRESTFVTVWLFSFICSYSILAGLYEGNLGSAFRHKSTVLWPLFVITLSHLQIALGQADNLFRRINQSRDF